MPTYVEDGWNLPGYVAAAPESTAGERLWDAVEFEYRPATRAECIRLDAEIRVASNSMYTDPQAGIKIDRLSSDFTAKHLISWDVKNSKGEMVPCKEEALQRIHNSVFQKIHFIIRGMETSDPRPGQETKDPTDVGQEKN